MEQAEAAVREKEDEKGLLQEKATALEEAVKASEKALEEANDNAEEKKAALTKAEEELDTAKQELETVLAAHEELAEARKVCEEKADALETAKQERDAAQEALKKAEEDCESKSEALEEAQKALTAAENAANASDEELTEEGLSHLVDLREAVTKAEAEVEEAKAAVVNAQEAVDESQKVYDEAEKKYAAALADLALAQAAYDSFVDEEVPEAKVYAINSGDVVEYTLGTLKEVVIVCDGELEALESIAVDGQVLDAAKYTVVSGSTILTLKSEYLETLSVGEHKVEFIYKDGKAEAKLIVREKTETENQSTNDQSKDDQSKEESQNEQSGESSKDQPKTGDPGILGLLSMLGLSGTALAGVYMLKRKEERSED